MRGRVAKGELGVVRRPAHVVVEVGAVPAGDET
jgi:hypothetical protein